MVKIEFAAKIRMRAIEDMLKGMGKGDPEQEERALDALRVLDIVLRESASERCTLAPLYCRACLLHIGGGRVGVQSVILKTCWCIPVQRVPAGA